MTEVHRRVCGTATGGASPSSRRRPRRTTTVRPPSAKTRRAQARSESPRSQLDRFIARYLPRLAAEGRVSLTKLRRLAPGAVELVYDNFNWLVVGFCPSERASDAVFSLVFRPRWLALCFLQNGPELSDPQGLLRGSGKRVRTLRFETARDLDDPAVRALIAEALARARVHIDANGRRQMFIRAISTRQRPRRPA